MSDGKPTLLEEDDALSQSAITLPVRDDDVRAAFWIGHRWTRRLAVGGGLGALSLIGTLFGLWASGMMSETRGVRMELVRMAEAFEKRLDVTDARTQGLAERAAARDARLDAIDARLQAIESRLEAQKDVRWMHSMDIYEDRLRRKLAQEKDDDERSQNRRNTEH